jgi:hypothetical protein
VAPRQGTPSQQQVQQQQQHFHHHHHHRQQLPSDASGSMRPDGPPPAGASAFPLGSTGEPPAALPLVLGAVPPLMAQAPASASPLLGPARGVRQPNDALASMQLSFDSDSVDPEEGGSSSSSSSSPSLSLLGAGQGGGRGGGGGVDAATEEARDAASERGIADSQASLPLPDG